MEMGRNYCMMVLGLLLIKGAVAAIHSVSGWAVPNDSSFYSTWAANEKSFYVEEQLQFTWSGTHNVANATKEEYDNCAKTAKVLTSKSGHLIDLTTSGPQYFICTVDQHCQSGQKLAINVTAGTNPLTPTSRSSPPPPPPTSASALSFATLSGIVLVSTALTSPFTA